MPKSRAGLCQEIRRRLQENEDLQQQVSLVEFRAALPKDLPGEQWRALEAEVLAHTQRGGRFGMGCCSMPPPIYGEVYQVGLRGVLVTLRLARGRIFARPGHCFAIYDPRDGYLGEATLTSICNDKRHAFAKMTVRRDGARAPRLGDRAATNLDSSGGSEMPLRHRQDRSPEELGDVLRGLRRESRELQARLGRGRMVLAGAGRER